jgi:hypothetical protein
MAIDGWLSLSFERVNIEKNGCLADGSIEQECMESMDG